MSKGILRFLKAFGGGCKQVAKKILKKLSLPV